MLPIVGVPETLKRLIGEYREIFCREAGFNHISRYLTGLIVSDNKTLQGIYANLAGEKKASRRAMHEAVFESGWEKEKLMPKHRSLVSKDHKGKGREVISIDWTLSHHEKGAQIFGVKKSYDYVNRRMSKYQILMTAVIANRDIIDGIEVKVQTPNYEKEEKEYLKMTSQESYQEMEKVKERLIELVTYQKNRLAYRKKTEMAVEMVEQIEAEGNFPEANYAFDNGVLTVQLTQMIESKGKHWVSEIESNRLIMWEGKYQRVDQVAKDLRINHPGSFRICKVKNRQGEVKEFLVFTKAIRLKKYGKKRLVIVHEKGDLSDQPRFLLTDALHWESGRVIETWNYRWPVEVFHEFAKQETGLESAQVRNEEAVKRHFCLSCVAQSLLQRVSCAGGKSEKFKFAKSKPSIGQRLYSLSRECLSQLLSYAMGLFEQGYKLEQVVEELMPI